MLPCVVINDSPKAPAGIENEWVVTRVKPGSPNDITKQAEVLIEKNRWISWNTWEDARKTYDVGKATTFQKLLLKWGHWSSGK